MLKLWRKRYLAIQHEEQQVAWVFIKIKNCILSNYLKGLKRYARYKQLKRRASHIHISQLAQRTFKLFKMYQIKSRKCRSLFIFVTK